MPLEVVIAPGGEADEELAAAASGVEIEERLGQPTRYYLYLELDIVGDDLPLLADSRLDPDAEIRLLVPAGGGAENLAQGPVTGQRISLRDGGGGSRLEVQGADASVAMDRESRVTAWPEVRDSDAVTSIVSGYGLVPDVEATSALHPTTGHALIQRGSDLAFVQRLARRNGFLFWVTHDELGIGTAHFKSPPLDGSPVATLTINQAEPSTDWVEISWDAERPAAVTAQQLDLMTKGTLDGSVEKSPLPLLGSVGLSDLAGGPRSTHLAAPADDSGDLTARAEGVAIDAGWFVRARLTTDRVRVPEVLRAHSLVTLAGAGSRFSGDYLVAGVRHVIDAVGHTMHLDLIRNAWEADSALGLL